MRRTVDPESSAGFTLVEMLAATLLMGIILATLATITAQWLPNWNRGVTQLQREKILATGLDRLTGDLAAAEFVSVGSGNARPVFDGDDLSVTFVRTTLEPNAGPGLQVVRIAETSDNEGGPTLVRSTAPLPIGASQGVDANALDYANSVVVIRSPYRVSFSYAGPDREWRDDWHGQPVLPRAVRIQIRDNATSALLAATTSTLIHAELPASCTWTGVVSNCPIANHPGAAGTAAGNAANANPQGAVGTPFGGAVNAGQ
jgi:general secretion pathway protein J